MNQSKLNSKKLHVANVKRGSEQGSITWSWFFLRLDEKVALFFLTNRVVLNEKPIMLRQANNIHPITV